MSNAHGTHIATGEQLRYRFIAAELLTALEALIDLWNSKDATSPTKSAFKKRAKVWSQVNRAVANAKAAGVK